MQCENCVWFLKYVQYEDAKSFCCFNPPPFPEVYPDEFCREFTPKDKSLVPQKAVSSPENRSGQEPVEYKLIVKNDDIEQVSPGGIFMPAHVVEKEQKQTSNVTLVAIGGNAFEDWKGRIPKLGDRVRIAKYAGEFILKEQSMDGSIYQIITDKDVITILDQEPEEKTYAASDQPDNAGDGRYSHLRSTESNQ